MKHWAVAALVLIGASNAKADADLRGWIFEGSVTAVGAPFVGLISVGDPFTTSYSWDFSVPSGPDYQDPSLNIEYRDYEYQTFEILINGLRFSGSHEGGAQRIQEGLWKFGKTYRVQSDNFFGPVLLDSLSPGRMELLLYDARVGSFPFLPLDWDEPSALNGAYMSVSYSVEGMPSGIEGRMTTISRWDPGQVSPVPEPGSVALIAMGLTTLLLRATQPLRSGHRLATRQRAFQT